jgi:DNA-binding MarR family transcriptional regulator
MAKHAKHQNHSKTRERILARLATSNASTGEIATDLGLDPTLASYLCKDLERRGAIAATEKKRGAPWALARKLKDLQSYTATAAAATRARQPRVDGITLALDKLSLRLAAQPVAHLETKVQVLERLGKLVDPTIAKILGDISADLQRVAA